MYSFRVNSPASSEQQNTSYFHDSSQENESKLLDNADFKENFVIKDLKPQKWSCTACTYSNWPRSKHCIQCLTVKKSDIPKNEENPENGQNENGSSDIVSENFLASNDLCSPVGSTANLASSKDIISDEKWKSKWICQVSFLLVLKYITFLLSCYHPRFVCDVAFGTIKSIFHRKIN